MDVNRALSVNSGIGKRGARPGSLTRRSTQRLNPTFEPKTEWMDTPEAHVLVAELPGFKNDEVKVQLDGGENVTISGGRLIRDQVLREGTWQPRRRVVSRFKKLFPLPENVDIEGYTSRFENEKMYITFNKLKALSEVKSTDVIDQESKSLPQVGESSANFIEELSEKTDDKPSSNKLDQSLRDENVIIPTVTKSKATKDEKASNNKLDKSTKDEKFEAPNFVKSSASQDEKASRNKQDQSPRDEKQDDKESSNTIDQSPRDEKVQTPGDAKSTMAQDEKELSNKFHQIPSEEMVKTPGGAKSTMTQDEKELSNKPHQISGEEKVEALGGAESTMGQDEKELSNKTNQIPREELVEAPEVVKFSAAVDDKASGNKQDQSPRDEKLETPGDANSTTTHVNKVSIDKPHQSPGDEKVETPRGPKSTTAQNDKELSNKPDQSPRDEMIETKEIANSGAPQDENESNSKSSQSSREEKVQTPEGTQFIAATLDKGKVGTPKVVSSSITEEAIQEKKQLEASNKVGELAKHPPLLNEEKLVDSTTLPNQSELLDSKQEVKMKVGDQREQILVENPEVKSNPPDGDQNLEEKVSCPKAKKEGDNFDLSQTKKDKREKAKQSNFRAFNHVTRFLPPRREVIVAGIAVFSLVLFITSKCT